ncbi:MAG: transposase [Terriglobia bacterium]
MHAVNKGKGHPPRLKGWDYSWAGGYFVTFLVKGRLCCLSTIDKGKLQSSPSGEIVQQCWLELPTQFPQVVIDEMVIMPNHVHAVVLLTDTCGAFIYEGPREALINQGPTNQGPTNQGSTKQGSLKPMMSDPQMVLGKVIRAWKAKSARLIHQAGHPSFAWQSRYYEHIIRGESELDQVRVYIANNPMQWDIDSENPNRRETP